MTAGSTTFSITGNVSAGASVNVAAISGGYVKVNNGNIINNANAHAISTARKVTYNPGAANYIQYPTTGSTANYPTQLAPGNVRDAVVHGSTTGTLELPAEADVELGVGYGEDGTEFTGTLAAGGGGPLIGPSALISA